METLETSGIRIGAVLSNKKSWHKLLLLGQIAHYLTDIMAEKTPLKSIGCAQIWQEVMEHSPLILVEVYPILAGTTIYHHPV